MPKAANAFASISKKMETLKVKSERLAREIADLSAQVAAEASKAQSTTTTPAAKKPLSKKASTATLPVEVE